MANDNKKGRGWHGDPKGHAKAGKQSPTKFQEGSREASDAGKKGGEAAQKKGTAHKLTDEERSRGGQKSRGGGRNSR